MSNKCSFHPSREAQFKCVDCGKNICLDCKAVDPKTAPTQHNYYIRDHDVCFECYYNYQIDLYKKGSYGCLCLTLFGAILTITFYLFMSTNPYADIFFYSPVMVLGGLTLIAFIAFLNKKFRRDKKKLKKYSNLKEKFLGDTKKDNELRKCGECGGKIDDDVKICPHCGSEN